MQAAVDELLDAKSSGVDSSTVLVIAHRLSTVKRADLVIVMEKGRIVETGKWETLSQLENGIFASMLKLQGLN